MARNLWLSVVLVLAALGVGFFGGWISSGYNNQVVEAKIKELSDKLDKESEQADELDKRLTQQVAHLMDSVKLGQLAKLKIAFVRSPEEVMLKYKGTEELVKQFREESAKRQAQIDALQKRFDAGELTRKEFEERVNQLRMELAQLDQQLTNEIADKILVTVNEIGREKAYDLILKRKDVVLFYEEGLLEDITDQVIERMNAAHK